MVEAQPRACATRSSGDGAGIDEAGFVQLGRREQFVTIRGDDRSNPVLLHVHGGPGVAFSAFRSEFAPYEADFTVVQWDQRGSGCSFGRHGDATPDVTLERLASDGVELAEHLRSRFGDRKIIALGHSFGSIVAVEMIRRAPEHFALYVGTGQFVSFAGAIDAQIARLRESAAGDPDLTVPFVVIQGSDDWNTPVAAARTYLERVEAPWKDFVVVARAGHFAHLTHTPQFLAALRERAERAISR
jgi:pimeloyl-ACP methyl ester carboxylesterase